MHACHRPVTHPCEGCSSNEPSKGQQVPRGHADQVQTCCNTGQGDGNCAPCFQGVDVKHLTPPHQQQRRQQRASDTGWSAMSPCACSGGEPIKPSTHSMNPLQVTVLCWQLQQTPLERMAAPACAHCAEQAYTHPAPTAACISKRRNMHDTKASTAQCNARLLGPAQHKPKHSTLRTSWGMLLTMSVRLTPSGSSAPMVL